MKKILLSFIMLIIVSCASNAIIREYKYSYKMKSADDVLFDIVTILENEKLEMVGDNTRQSINTTHGMFFVDILETDWKDTGIQNDDGNNYELKYRIWVPVEGSMKQADLSNLNDAYAENKENQVFGENVVSIESFVSVFENGEYKIKEAIPRPLFDYLEQVPIKISGILEHTGLSKESELRLQEEVPNTAN